MAEATEVLEALKGFRWEQRPALVQGLCAKAVALLVLALDEAAIEAEEGQEELVAQGPSWAIEPDKAVEVEQVEEPADRLDKLQREHEVAEIDHACRTGRGLDKWLRGDR
jgi:hypothetical protein